MSASTAGPRDTEATGGQGRSPRTCTAPRPPAPPVTKPVLSTQYTCTVQCALVTHRGDVQRGRDPAPVLRPIPLAQCHSLLEVRLNLPASARVYLLSSSGPGLNLAPEVVADDPHPGPLLVPLDAVIVPAQRRVHLTAQGGHLAFPVMVSNK